MLKSNLFLIITYFSFFISDLVSVFSIIRFGIVALYCKNFSSLNFIIAVIFSFSELSLSIKFSLFLLTSELTLFIKLPLIKDNCLGYFSSFLIILVLKFVIIYNNVKLMKVNSLIKNNIIVELLNISPFTKKHKTLYLFVNSYNKRQIMFYYG